MGRKQTGVLVKVKIPCTNPFVPKIEESSLIMRLGKFTSRLRFSVGRRLVKKHVVLELDEPSRLDRRNIPGEEIMTFSENESVPPEVLSSIVNAYGEEYLEALRAHLEFSSAKVTLLFAQKALASVSWIRSGRDIPNFIIPLSEHDQVFSRGYTAPNYRGSGCYARCITAGYDSVSAKSKNRFLTACHIYNLPSIRQFERFGFRPIAYGRWH